MKKTFLVKFGSFSFFGQKCMFCSIFFLNLINNEIVDTEYFFFGYFYFPKWLVLRTVVVPAGYIEIITIRTVLHLFKFLRFFICFGFVVGVVVFSSFASQVFSNRFSIYKKIEVRIINNKNNNDSFIC